MKILTIVVPAYNVEKYLKRCLDSVKLESVMSDIEVLIVNDGSKDKTPQIAAEYENCYPETYRLINKENGGHGSTINTGIKNATGKYFKVVDGDDWLNADEIEQYIEAMKTHDADVIATDFQCVQDETYNLLESWNATSIEEHYGKTVKVDSGAIKEPLKLHSFTIKTEILQEHDITIDEHCFYVDSEFVFYPMKYVETVYYHKAKIYMYRLGRDGQSMNMRSMQRNVNQQLKVLKHLLEDYDECKDTLTLAKRAYIERGISLVVEIQFKIFISMGFRKGTRKKCKEWDVELRRKYPEIYAATKRKSIDLIRKSNYMILPIGAIVLKVK